MVSLGLINLFCYVSIHAPTRGATYFAKVDAKEQILFQSTHPRGVRHNIFQVRIINIRFQSTHPRGVRLGSSSQSKANKMFQSTHPRGVRL